MPLELGLAVMLERSRLQRHQWFVFEAEPHRLARTLSDLNGTDPHIHGATAEGVLRALLNALVRRHPRPTLEELRAILQDVEMAAEAIRGELPAGSPFEARAFRDLVIAARRSAANRIKGLRGRSRA